MKFGPVPPTKVPRQDPIKVLLLAERWQRAAEAHAPWAKRAKQAFDFFEGRHYTVAQIAKLTAEGRPSFKFNMIGALVRLVLGYHASHKTDITFLPGNDARSTELTANALSQLAKTTSNSCGLQYTDVEVFLDGLVGGRGFYDSRLDFEENDLGEWKARSSDPFGTYLDPDASTYDLNDTASYVQTTKMVSIDEIEAAFGKQIAAILRPFTLGQTPVAPVSSLPVLEDDISPVRYFGERDENNAYWDQFYSYMGNDHVDTYRKTIRIIETQYRVRENRNVMIDLETGDRKILPLDWNDDKIQKVLLYAASINNPCVVERRMVDTLQWTTSAADLLLYDAPSIYQKYTISPYFPYFRRGFTKGMVEDLVDPQMEKNKRRNAQIEIVSRTANGGWIYHENSLTQQQQRQLKKFGSTPGVHVKWSGKDANMKPEQIAPAKSPLQHERLEKEADDDFHGVSGINPSALGEIDRVQSGRAIEARTKQAVLSIQSYIDNFTRAKRLLGDNFLSIVQTNYTEPRFYRVLGEDSKLTKLLINESMVDPSTGIKRILNDVTIGKYTVVVDPAPLSATFQQAQFEEMMEILERLGPIGQAVVPAVVDLIIGMSSLPRKDDWVARIQQALGAGAAAQQQGAQPGAPGQPPQQQLPPGAPAPAQLPPPQPAPVAG